MTFQHVFINYSYMEFERRGNLVETAKALAVVDTLGLEVEILIGKIEKVSVYLHSLMMTIKYNHTA